MAAIAAATLAATDTEVASFASGIRLRLGLDHLSACFLLLIAVVGMASALAGLAEPRTREASLCGWLGLGFIAAMVLLVLARDSLSLLVAWEAMSLFPAATILVTSRGAVARRNLLIYLGTAHLAGAGVWIGLLYLGQAGGAGAAATSIPGSVGALMLLGCAAKAGLVPLQFWLPRAHPLAPPHISALMSGVMIALPFYLIIRLAFAWADPLPSGLGYGLIAAGAASAVFGAYSAVMAGEMKRLLAFSSIENMGFASISVGLAIVLQAAGRERASALALAISLFGLGAHGLAKSTLFIATGPLGRLAGKLELDHLGGLVHRTPAAVGIIAVACISLAALPPLAGFAAEWMLLQAVIEAGQLGGAAGFVLIATAVPIGLAAGLAALAFCKLLGLGFLGTPRRSEPEVPGAVGALALSAMALPVALLIALGLATGWVMGWLVAELCLPLTGSADLMPIGAAATLKLPGSGGLPMMGLFAALLLLGGAIGYLRGPSRAVAAPTWTCGQPQSPRLIYTGAGFAKTLRLATSRVRGNERETRGHGPGLAVFHAGEDPHPFQWRLHRPALRRIQSASARVRRLQSGRLRTYLMYLVLTLLVALMAARAGAL